MINEYENTPFGDTRPIREILDRINKLINFKPSIACVSITKKQFNQLWDSMSDDNKKIVKVLKVRGRPLVKLEGCK